MIMLAETGTNIFRGKKTENFNPFDAAMRFEEPQIVVGLERVGWDGACSSPTKYGLNGTIPATVNNTVGSCGIRLADLTRVCPLSAKYPENDSRKSFAEEIGGRELDICNQSSSVTRIG
jgi:hypothetical protein